MKYLILVGDGMGDRPVAALDGRTPLAAADTPHMDRLAQTGRLGLTRTIPDGMSPGSDTANMSLMGYDPVRYHTGRSPIEAAAMGVELMPGQIAFRCNLVTLNRAEGGAVMTDYAAGHITSPEAAELIRAVDAVLGRPGLKFHPGVSYRHLLVWDNGPLGAATVPPHDYSGQEVGRFLPSDGDLGQVAELVRASWPVLAGHPVNQARRAAGKNPADSIWLWGQGTRPSLPTIPERFGLSGFTVSAVDLVKGLGLLAGLRAVDVAGATGWLDTNYAGKVAAVLAGLAGGDDLAFLHVEAPDEAGHSGKLDLKLQAIAEFDRQVVGPVLAGLARLGEHRVLLVTDHYTPLEVMTHTREAVPFALWDSRAPQAGGAAYNEAAAADTGWVVEKAHDLIGLLAQR